MDAASTPVDVRDVIAERIAALSRPVNAFARIVEANADLPARANAQAFLTAWEGCIAAYAAFLEGDLVEAQARAKAEQQLIATPQGAAAN